jgi:hypothetical protein
MAQERLDEYQWDKAFVDGGPSPIGNPGPYLQLPVDHFAPGGIYDHSTHRVYPRVQVGDVFWCKEAWRTSERDDNLKPSDLKENCPIQYKSPLDSNYASPLKPGKRWRSPLFMPKWAVRLWLRATRIRIQRVQEISEADAIAEGVYEWWREYSEGKTVFAQVFSGQELFKALWNSIHKDKHPWEANEWCLAYSFERVDR